MKKIDFSLLTDSQLSEWLDNQESFEVLNVSVSHSMGMAIEQIEKMIESKGMRSRVYTYGRIAAAGGTLFGGITGFLGLASVVGIAAHNLATINPDYEISKHLVDNMLTVKYCK